MNKKIIILGILISALCSCKHVFFSNEEKDWINALDQEDTLYFCDTKGSIATLIPTYFNFRQPKTDNPFDLNPNQIEVGNDGSSAGIAFLFNHSGDVIHIDLYFSARQTSYHDLEVDINNCRFCYVEDFENFIKNKTTIILYKNRNEFYDTNIDFLVFNKDEGLSSLSIDGNIFNRCKIR